ncbi:MAG: C25 family cysteine peptidase, partial [Vicinamibacteria bacterium]
ARDLRLSRHGEAVPYHLEPNEERFAPGSVLYFMSEGAAANPFGEEAVYELEVGRPGEAMTSLSAAPAGEAQRFYRGRAEWEENRYYQAALVDAPDVWLWELLFAPEVKSYSFYVSSLAPSPHAAKLSVWLQGTSDFPVDPDHHVRVYVNGTLVHEVRWDGKRAQRVESDLAPGLLREGNNVLELENVGDTEASYSMVMLDKFAVEYPRIALPADGRLEGRWSESGTAELSELGPGTRVLDTSEARPLWLTDSSLDANGRLRFRVESGHRYLAVSAYATYHPAVSIPPASRLKDTRNQADYLAIGPQIFIDAAASLLERRRDEGLAVKSISIEEIYSEFGFGESSPDAVKDFLSYAFHQWRQPSPRYVLLLGDATYDFKNYLQTGVVNRVPPRMVRTSYLWTASDASYAMVNGDDLLPDLAIGRLPAATVAEVDAMIDKVLAYEDAGTGVHASVVLIADNADEAGDFEADADRRASGILAPNNPTKIYLSRLGAGAARGEILRSFDEGASLVSYIGHGGIHLWADENFFNTGDIAALAPQPQKPLLLTMNCLNGYFHFPYFDSLAEALVKVEAKGAVAAFSPSGLSLNGPANLYQEALLKELVHGRHRRLGDAILAAQAAYAESGAFPELLTIYQLIGDPALTLP